jgi:hypothetical protein
VSICAIYPQATGGSQAVCGAETVWCQNECDGRGPRVDFIIHLPHSIRLLNLVSVNGSITGRFSKENWPGQLNIRTINGNITLQMPPDVNTDLELQIPRRHLRSDFVLSGARARKYGGRVDALIGNGGGSLKISTVGGYVALRRNNLSPTSRVVPVRQTAHTGA